MPTVTLDDVVKQARIIYAAMPNATNGGKCVYTREDGGHCLASQILVNLGVPVPEVADGFLNARYVADLVASGWFATNDWKIEVEALALLSRLQRQADTGFTGTQLWRTALATVFGNNGISLQ